MLMNDYKNSINEGVSAEERFSNLAIARGFNVKKSTVREDIYNHIDLFLIRNGKTHSFDIKAQKRVSRSNSNYSDEIIWIELKNVNGNSGWLYGKQDFIAFEQADCFIVVNRLSLVDYIESFINNDLPYVNSSKDALYKLYQRNGRKDCITQIRTSDLYKLKHKIWNK